jgi:hypothetical protein
VPYTLDSVVTLVNTFDALRFLQEVAPALWPHPSLSGLEMQSRKSNAVLVGEVPMALALHVAWLWVGVAIVLNPTCRRALRFTSRVPSRGLLALTCLQLILLPVISVSDDLQQPSILLSDLARFTSVASAPDSEDPPYPFDELTLRDNMGTTENGFSSSRAPLIQALQPASAPNSAHRDRPPPPSRS